MLVGFKFYGSVLPIEYLAIPSNRGWSGISFTKWCPPLDWSTSRKLLYPLGVNFFRWCAVLDDGACSAFTGDSLFLSHSWVNEKQPCMFISGLFFVRWRTKHFSLFLYLKTILQSPFSHASVNRNRPSANEKMTFSSRFCWCASHLLMTYLHAVGASCHSRQQLNQGPV